MVGKRLPRGIIFVGIPYDNLPRQHGPAALVIEQCGANYPLSFLRGAMKFK
jgi:hypothetical protein